jgi:hypothetical protein
MSGLFNNGQYCMEPLTFYNQTTQPPDYLAGRRFVPLGSSLSDAPTLIKPTARDLFVWIYFKKSRLYHLSTNYRTTKPQNYPTTAFVWQVFTKSAQIARNFSHPLFTALCSLLSFSQNSGYSFQIFFLNRRDSLLEGTRNEWTKRSLGRGNLKLPSPTLAPHCRRSWRTSKAFGAVQVCR